MTAKAIPATLEPVAGLCAALFSAFSFVLSALPLILPLFLSVAGVTAYFWTCTVRVKVVVLPRELVTE